MCGSRPEIEMCGSRPEIEICWSRPPGHYVPLYNGVQIDHLAAETVAEGDFSTAISQRGEEGFSCRDFYWMPVNDSRLHVVTGGP